METAMSVPGNTCGSGSYLSDGLADGLADQMGFRFAPGVVTFNENKLHGQFTTELG